MAPSTITLTSADGSTAATYIPDAAMLCSSFTVDGDELLDPGKGLDAYAAEGHTMGIPLLYPWANRLAAFGYEVAGATVALPDDRTRLPADPNGLPIHGVLPSLLRFEARTEAHDSAVDAVLRWDTPQLLELFPFAHELRIAIRVAERQLTIVTTVAATGADHVPVTFGFHPYLRLPGTSRTSWQLRLPAAEHLTLDEQMIPTGERSAAPDGDVALADSSWDDGFALREQRARYVAQGEGAGIAAEFVAGFPFSQIYAPPGKDFICFEPMTAPTNALRSGEGLTVLAPGDEYRAEFRISYWRR